MLFDTMIYKKAGGILANHLNADGYKYISAKKHLLKKDKGHEMTLQFTRHHSGNPFFYDENTNTLFVQFRLTFGVRSSAMEKWYFDKVHEPIGSSFTVEQFTLYMEITVSDFAADEPASAEQYYRRFASAGAKKHPDSISFTDMLEQLPKILDKMNDHTDIVKVYERNPQHHAIAELLIYGGHLDLANAQLDKYYQDYLDTISQKDRSSEDRKFFINHFEKFIKNTELLTGRVYANPYKRQINVLENQNKELAFSDKTIFREQCRLDISIYNISYSYVSDEGEVLLYTFEKEIIKLNREGRIVFEGRITAPKGFDPSLFEMPMGSIPDTGMFFINNYILTAENQLQEFQLPVLKMKGKALQESRIADMAYSAEEQKYYLLYLNLLLVYSADRVLEKSIEIGEDIPKRIILNKRWVVYQTRNKYNSIWNFDGALVGKYSFGNGNDWFELSSDGKDIFNFFYRTKSQLHPVPEGEAFSLMAHPTYLEGYKEISAEFSEYNYGIHVAKFSPDNQYLVAGASMGAYVAWTLPGLKRIDLMPSPRIIEEYGKAKHPDPTSIPAIVEYEGQRFFRTRHGDMSKVFFFENGDIFVTEIASRQMLLLWDRSFNCYKYFHMNGFVNVFHNKYLLEQDKKELVLYAC